MKNIGKPCAGKPHVRFDEDGRARTRPLLNSLLLFLVLGFLMFSFYKLIVVDRMGFCYKRFWFVSSKELTLKTIDGLMKSGQMKLDAADVSPQAYLAHHPNCCSVDWGGEGAFGRGLIFFGSAEVTVIYEMSEEGRRRYGGEGYYKGGSKETYYEFIANDTACGETVGYVGTTVTRPIERKSISNK